MHISALDVPTQVLLKRCRGFCFALSVYVLLRLLESAVYPTSAGLGDSELCITASDLQLAAEKRFVPAKKTALLN